MENEKNSIKGMDGIVTSGTSLTSSSYSGPYDSYFDNGQHHVGMFLTLSLH